MTVPPFTSFASIPATHAAARRLPSDERSTPTTMLSVFSPVRASRAGILIDAPGQHLPGIADVSCPK